MTPFHEKHAAGIEGTLSSVDRIVFKGHLKQLCHGPGVEKFLARKGLLIKEFGGLAERLSKQLCAAGEQMASEAGRPYEYLPSYRTRKEQRARAIAERDGVTEGLIAVFGVVEGAQSFRVASGKGRPCIRNAPRKCKCLYFYYLDPEFGLMHVRVQSWLPFPVQVCLNGQEWLRRQLDKEAIGYEMVENSFARIDDWERAQELADTFVKIDWPALLSACAARVNPLLGTELSAMGYYWVADQVEFATDIAFTDRKSLAPLYRKLLRHAMLHFGAEDVMGFLGKKLDGRFKGELVSDLKDRWYGRRIKHRAKRNWIKMYDKQGLVLRVETVINDPYAFKVRRMGKKDGERVMGWFPLCKGVGYLYRFAEVARAANRCYLEALAVVDDPRKADEYIRGATRRKKHKGRGYRAVNPASSRDRTLFRAVLNGAGMIQGFTNRQIVAILYGSAKRPKRKQATLRGRTSRDLKWLHVHGLIRKVKGSRRWLVTKRGHSVMTTLLRCHEVHYHEEYMRLV